MFLNHWKILVSYIKILSEFLIKFIPFFFLLDAGSLDYKKDIEEIKSLVSKLYVNLNIEEHEKHSEEKILKQMEKLKIELEPLEQVS